MRNQGDPDWVTFCRLWHCLCSGLFLILKNSSSATYKSSLNFLGYFFHCLGNAFILTKNELGYVGTDWAIFSPTGHPVRNRPQVPRYSWQEGTQNGGGIETFQRNRLRRYSAERLRSKVPEKRRRRENSIFNSFYFLKTESAHFQRRILEVVPIRTHTYIHTTCMHMHTTCMHIHTTCMHNVYACTYVYQYYV
jgi:hypothetical protein